MHTYVEHELRAIRLQQSDDSTRFTELTQGLFERVKFLEAKPGYLREVVPALLQDVKNLLETRTALDQDMDTRFSLVSNRLGKLENPLQTRNHHKRG